MNRHEKAAKRLPLRAKTMNVIDLTMIDSDEDAAAPVAPANTGTIDLCYSSSDEAEAGAAPSERAPPLGQVDLNAGGTSTLKRDGAAAPRYVK